MPRTHQYDDDFERFFSAFPRKVAKLTAFKAWKKALASGATVPEIMAGLALSLRLRQWNKDDGMYVPYPSTWLHGRRWEDTPSPSELIPTRQEAKRQQSNHLQDEMKRVDESNKRFEAELAAQGLTVGDYLRQVKEKAFGRRRDEEEVTALEIEVPWDEKGNL